MQEIKIGGIYEHFKGNRYKVTGVARSSEAADTEFVVYETLYHNPLGSLWIRPLKMFQETVLRDGQRIPRFKLVKE